MYDIIIIGAGPAGLTASIYAARAGKSVLVLESVTPGGQVLQTHHIKNYPAFSSIDGSELSKKMHAQAKDLGTTFKLEQAISIQKSSEEKNRWQVITDDDNTYSTNAIILAIGTTYRHIGLPNETELTGHGISYCATCDGELYKNQPIAVYGGGNSAFYSALYLSGLAKKIYLIHHRQGFRADDSLIQSAKENPKIEFILDAEIAELLTDAPNTDTQVANAPDAPATNTSKLSGLKVTNVISKEVTTLDISALFVSIGRKTDLTLINNSPDLDIKLDKDGYIQTDETCVTSESGIFAAGDCRIKSLRQIVTATSDGAIAATSAIESI